MAEAGVWVMGIKIGGQRLLAVRCSFPYQERTVRSVNGGPWEKAAVSRRGRDTIGGWCLHPS